MKKKERDRLKPVVYEAYMAGQAEGKKTEEIKTALGEKFHRTPRTIEDWIYDVRDERQRVICRLAEQQRLLAAQLGERYINPVTGAMEL